MTTLSEASSEESGTESEEEDERPLPKMRASPGTIPTFGSHPPFTPIPEVQSSLPSSSQNLRGTLNRESRASGTDPPPETTERIIKLEKEKEPRLTLGKVPERFDEYPEYRYTILSGVRQCGLRSKDVDKFLTQLEVGRPHRYGDDESEEIMALDNKLFDQIIKGLTTGRRNKRIATRIRAKCVLGHGRSALRFLDKKFR